MNLSSNPQMLEFPQLSSYSPEKVTEKDLDHDCSLESVDIEDHDSRVQVTHHLDKRDGVTEKQSIHDRLRAGKAATDEQLESRANLKEVEKLKLHFLKMPSLPALQPEGLLIKDNLQEEILVLV